MEFIYLIENYNYFIIVIFIIIFLNFIKIIFKLYLNIYKNEKIY